MFVYWAGFRKCSCYCPLPLPRPLLRPRSWLRRVPGRCNGPCNGWIHVLDRCYRTPLLILAPVTARFAP